MNVAPFQNFFIACLGASASFIGLLFVALSLVIGRADDAGVGMLEFSDRRLAETAFIGLANIFFTSLIAIMPDKNIGYASGVMAFAGLANSWNLFARAKEIRNKKKAAYQKGDLFWIAISALVYILEVIYSVFVIIHPNSIFDVTMITYIIIALFYMALIRSWQLISVKSDAPKKSA